MWLIGLTGNLLLSLCGIPLLVSTIRGKSYTSPWFLAAWGLGEVFAVWYGFAMHVPKIITVNYGISMLLILLIALAQCGMMSPPSRK